MYSKEKQRSNNNLCVTVYNAIMTHLIRLLKIHLFGIYWTIRPVNYQTNALSFLYFFFLDIKNAEIIDNIRDIWNNANKNNNNNQIIFVASIENIYIYVGRNIIWP